MRETRETNATSLRRPGPGPWPAPAHIFAAWLLASGWPAAAAAGDASGGAARPGAAGTGAAEWEAAVPAAPAAPDSLPEPPAPSLETAIGYYRDAEFDRAIQSLTGLIDGGRLTGADRISAHETLALSYIGKGEREAARRVIRRLLEIDHGYRPAPRRLHREYMWLYFEVRKELELSEPKSPGIKTIAILDFANNSLEDHDKLDLLRAGFADMLITEIMNLTSLAVVEREQVRWILDELDLEQSEKFDQDTAVRVGKQLGVHSVLIGSFMKVGGEMRLDTRLVSVETSRIIKTDKLVRKTDEYFKLTDDLALKIAGNLDVKVSEAERAAMERSGSKSDQALELYCEGLRFSDRGQYSEACRSFEASLAASPDYQDARQMLDTLRPLAGLAALTRGEAQ